MTLILGKSVATAEQLSSYLLSVNKTPKFSRNISVKEFCQLYIDIGNKEGVRGDLACVQCFKETGYLKYGGDVLYTQNNFAGLGTTGNGVKGCIFPDIETGILAHIQHLKSYATKVALNERCVDPRRTTWFMNVKGGTSPNIETLGGTWVVPTNTKNTAGSTDSSSKLFLIGATSQAANPQTYSHDTAYVGTDGCLYSGGKRVDTELISSTEPTGQVTGDFWLQAY